MTEADEQALADATAMVAADQLILTYASAVLFLRDLTPDPEVQAEAEEVASAVPIDLANVALARIVTQIKTVMNELGGVDFARWESDAKPVFEAYVPDQHRRDASIFHAQVCFFYRQPSVTQRGEPVNFPVTVPPYAALHGLAAGTAWLFSLMPDPHRAYKTFADALLASEEAAGGAHGSSIQA